MAHGVHHRLADGGQRQDGEILPFDASVLLPMPERPRPARGAGHLLVEPPGRLSGHDHIRALIRAGVGHAVDPEVRGGREVLRLLAERQEPEQCGVQAAVEFRQRTEVAQVVFQGRLRIRQIQALAGEVVAEPARVHVLNRRRGDRLLLGEHVAEGVEELLLHRRGFDAGSIPSHPNPAVVAQRLQPALTRHFDPDDGALRGFEMVASGPHRRVAAVLKEIRQTLAGGCRIPRQADHLAGIVHAEDVYAAARIAEGANRSPDEAKLQRALELGMRVFAFGDALPHLRPVHARQYSTASLGPFASGAAS